MLNVVCGTSMLKRKTFLDKYVKDDSIRSALQTYLDYVIKRKK